METKKVTLRSQTVQCPHCGEYYSVTYKYCPFCDAGRQEEERRLAEKKKKKQDFFGNLFGSHAGNKKESKPEKSPKAPSEEEGVQDYDLLEAVQPKPKQVRPSRDHAEKKPTVKETAKKKAPTRRRGPRKKTSEMTEEEKAAARADREARAAARKRERDRKAREAALAAAAQPAQEAQPDQVEMTATPGETGPVFDQPTVPETFGYDQPPLVEPDPAAFTPTPVSAEGPVVEPEPAPVQETPAFTPAAQGPAESEWDALKDLNTLAGQPEAAPEIPEAIPAPTAEIQVGQTTVEPAAPAQPAALPAAGDTGDRRQVHLVRGEGRALRRGLRDAVGAGRELLQVRDRPQLHDALAHAQGHAQGLAVCQGLFQNGPGVDLPADAHEAEHRPGAPILRQGQQVAGDGAVRRRPVPGGELGAQAADGLPQLLLFRIRCHGRGSSSFSGWAAP